MINPPTFTNFAGSGHDTYLCGPECRIDHTYPLTQDQYGVWWLKGRVHHVWIEQRPTYCDRGHYIAHVEPAPRAGTDYTIDASDLWPRYYMLWDNMLSELREWLSWREGDGPTRAGNEVFVQTGNCSNCGVSYANHTECGEFG